MSADTDADTTTTAAATLTASMGIDSFATDIRVAGFELKADQPADVEGGSGSGPNPFAYLYAALASCVLHTVRMYAARKQMPLERVELELTPTRRSDHTLESVDLRLRLVGDDLSDDDRAKLHDVAGRCPVHRTLEGGGVSISSSSA
jgi:putative redox protein